MASLEDYDTGLSLVHEVRQWLKSPASFFSSVKVTPYLTYSSAPMPMLKTGHWLGLLHVFESETSEEDGGDRCDPINDVHGDYVDDTPFIPRPSVELYDCSLTYYQGEEDSIPNSCPNLPGVDPVFNYMNYVGIERCLPEGVGEFTCGQIRRMYQQWLLHREHSEVCGDNEMKIDCVIHLQPDPSTLHIEITAVDGQEPIFRWERGMHIDLLDESDDFNFNYTRSFNLCVPSGEYVAVVTDTGRNGFVDGYVALYLDGNLIRNVSGNFGSTECIKFGSPGKVTDLDTGEITLPSYLPASASAG